MQVGLMGSRGGIERERAGLLLTGVAALGGLAIQAIFALPAHGQTAPAAQPQTPPPAKSEAHAPLTKEQAKDLFSRVDTILKFVSTDTGLPIQHSVKRKLLTRTEINQYLTAKFDEDQGAKRLERAEIVLKKFGLLDRDFHLQPFLISLLTEQVAGFYDNKTKTVNLLDWIEPDAQEPVLAHELTHALQDQKVDLAKWSEAGSNDIAKNVQEDNQHIATDEGDTARDAVAEGQAMVVFLDYSLRGTGKTLADSPEVADKMKDSIADPSGSPILARAPLLLQQSLLFPYSEGLSFEDAVLLKGGKEAAFSGTLANPPTSTFEVMHPAAFLAHAPVPMVQLPDIHPLIDAEYVPYDVGVMGEFDVRILTELFGGRQMADALTSSWNGGIYYAAQKRSATTPEAKQTTASLGLLYYSKWKNEDSARSFLHVYEAELPRKYSGLARRPKDETDDDEQVYSTSEGDVLLYREGTGVFVSEGFSLPLARKLRDGIVSIQSDAPLQIAVSSDTAQREHMVSAIGLADPGLSLVRLLASAGVMKAALPGAADGTFSGRYTFIRQ
jgi:hypothetical protein